ncbi:hypothetical protein [Viridibacillus arvi]|uniref:hypothetical protein n=1 Tax=Viridibacillus arvi TaxID=263475 RepID=UPI0034CDBD2B
MENPLYKVINEFLETSNLNLFAMCIVSFIIIGMVFIGISLFILKGGDPASRTSRLGTFYFGVTLLLVAAFLAFLNGDIPW